MKRLVRADLISSLFSEVYAFISQLEAKPNCDQAVDVTHSNSVPNDKLLSPDQASTLNAVFIILIWVIFQNCPCACARVGPANLQTPQPATSRDFNDK